LRSLNDIDKAHPYGGDSSKQGAELYKKAGESNKQPGESDNGGQVSPEQENPVQNKEYQ
jgi:hypothetical protein